MKDTIHECSHCTAQYAKWQGQCAECGKWGTITAQSEQVSAASAVVARESKSITPAARIMLGMQEVDTVLGGGIVAGSLLLLSGEPGIGKSTLVLQLAIAYERATQGEILYVCGEESPEQIHGRLQRITTEQNTLSFLPETELGAVLATITKQKPCLVIIDSIQTMHDQSISSERGSVAQIRAITARLLVCAKETHIPILIIGHVTKDGALAGPRSLEHLVDVVLSLEGDGTHAYRLLRSTKNRFGPTNYVGVFEMSAQGMVEVKNPAALFLESHTNTRSGSAITMIMEGTRPFLIEIQSLTNSTSYGYPKRATSGFELSRLELLLAVLSRRAGLSLEKQDVFVNIAGGLSVKDRSVDLAVCMAVASSLANQAVPESTCILGEVGLSGEIRPIAHAQNRIEQAARMGYKTIYMPHQKITRVTGSAAVPLSDIQEALALLGIVK